MSEYTDSLEKQNTELQDALAVAQTELSRYKPEWLRELTQAGTWHYAIGRAYIASIETIDGYFIPRLESVLKFNDDEIRFVDIEEAKKYVEKMIFGD
jgi:hypothetical protein